MNFKKIFAVAAVVIGSFIQVGCGSSTPTTNGYSQAVNGVCPVGTSLVANNQCAPINTGYNYGYNNGYNGTSCAQGASYQYTGGTYGSCNPGYILQGLTCTCQSSVTGTGTQNGACQISGYYSVQGGCYQQGPCYPGYAFVTPTGLCYRVQ